MKRKFDDFLFIVFIVGSALLLVYVLLPTNKNIFPVTETTVAEIGVGQVCVNIGPSSEDPIIDNLNSLGMSIDYVGEKWYFEGEFVSESASATDAFTACGSVELMNRVYAEREAIINAGGYGK